MADQRTLSELQEMEVDELCRLAESSGATNCRQKKKQRIISHIVKHNSQKEHPIIGSGVLEITENGFGFLRSSRNNYLATPDDIYIAPSQIRRFGIETGAFISGPVRAPKNNERYFALAQIWTINGAETENYKEKTPFDALPACYPQEKIILETTSKEIEMRVLDLLTPLGRGQRGLIVAPPKTGKTILLQKIAQAISRNYPDIHLIVLLIDERPEEVSDMLSSVKAEIIYSTFDAPARQHISVAEMVINKAKRMVEMNEDVVIVVDSLTRLVRAYNSDRPSSGRTLTGGIDASAFQKSKHFLGAGRNIKDGGSLTILATALVQTGSRMDDLIFEEFKGRGNMEVYLSRQLAYRRIFPAIEIARSGTRHEELLLEPEHLDIIARLRRKICDLKPEQAMEKLVEQLHKTKNNKEFFHRCS